MSRGTLRAVDGGVVVAVHAQPGSKREGAGPMHGERLRVRVAAPPEDGRANARVVEVLAAAFGLKRGDVRLVAGETSRAKDVLLAGLDVATARARLDALVAGSDEVRA